MWYSSYFGDSLTACRLSVYALNENLDTKNAYYTDITPEDYYDANTDNSLLGTKAYTAVDLSAYTFLSEIKLLKKLEKKLLKEPTS